MNEHNDKTSLVGFMPFKAASTRQREKTLKGVQWLLVLGLCLSTAGGCATKVKRVEVSEQIDLSGNWNDYDAGLVAQEMIADALVKPWREEFIKASGRNPVVIVGHIQNKTDEHIDADVFIKQLERSLLNSGKVSFVASSDERQGVRDERDDQNSGYASEETRARQREERGADYMLIGSLHSVDDATKGKAVVFYQANLELIDLETNEKVWIGEKQIKKLVKRPKYTL